ncbi:MAG: hypothetical protein JOZ24_09420 [Candidatus Eremiobacteraeota bacterium]|nr:hypothetical protein [Candidatus Eremiobacteraeota bacterium]
MSLARLLTAVLADEIVEQAFQESTVFYFTGTLDRSVIDCAAPLPPRPTLRYHNEPPELLRFAATGMDGEQMGLLQLAEELPFDELPVVGYFPMEFGRETFALGDDLESGIRAAMSIYDRQGEEITPLSLPEVFPTPLRPAASPAWAPHTPPARKGYRFEMTSDRVGVFAPEEAFGAVHRPFGGWPYRMPRAGQLEDLLARAEGFLTEGFPASAIAVARELRVEASQVNREIFGRSVQIWRDAAMQLGRTWLAAMVDEIVAPDLTVRSGTAYGTISFSIAESATTDDDE